MKKALKTIRIGLMFGLVLAATVSLEAGRAKIRLLGQAAIETDVVTLAQIAHIQCDDAGRQERLEQMVVTAVTADGPSERLVSLFEINRVLAQANIPPGSLDIFGASQCRVIMENSKTDNPPSRDPLAEAVAKSDGQNKTSLSDVSLGGQCRRMIARSTGFAESRLIVDWEHRYRDFMAKEFDERQYSIRPRSPMTLGQVRFAIEASQNRAADGRAVPVYVSGEVKVQGEVVMARRHLPAGHVITEDDVEVKCMHLTDIQDMARDGLKGMIGLEVARPIRARQIVQPDRMLRKMILVERKSAVNIVSQVGEIIIEMPGIALEDGSLDETIAVSSEGDRKNVIHVRVIGRGRVATITSSRKKTNERGPIQDANTKEHERRMLTRTRSASGSTLVGRF